MYERRFEIASPLPGAVFGATVKLAQPLSRKMPDGLTDASRKAGGLLLVPGSGDRRQPAVLLLQMSYLFGPEVEDYRYLLTSQNVVHQAVPEIFMVTNMVPNFRPPPKRPDPPLTADGRFPVQYPQRNGWHTDQSYRRPPPDISLFFAVNPVARERGQTLFANGALAYDALPAALKARVENLRGCMPNRAPVVAAATPRPARRRGPSRRTNGRSRSPWCARTRSQGGRRSISASAARWTGLTAPSSAWRRVPSATAPGCSMNS